MIKTVLGIDPGKNIGIARFDVEDKEILHQNDSIINWENFVIVLDAIAIMAQQRRASSSEPVVTVVMEDFLLFSHKAKAQIGSRMEAAQVIGAVKYVVGASKGKMNLVMQPPSINQTAAKWSGRGTQILRDKEYHLPDNVSASNHAHYWLVSKGYLRHRLLDS